MRTATVTIDTSALTHNLDQVRQRAPKSRILAMVKADAYGHGINNCINALSGADALGVATFEEAQKIRFLGWAKSIIMIEGAFSLAEWTRCQALEIVCVVHHQLQVNWALAQIADEDSPNRTIWLKVNTGMNRLGFAPDEILPIAKRLYEAGYQLVLTAHFANADYKEHPLNQQQIALFQQLLTRLHTEVSPQIKASLCNSAGLIHFPQYHYDWVRPGIMLYGSSPVTESSARQLNLRAVMQFESKLMAIHDIVANDCIGYGSIYKAQKNLKKGIVSIGYGDGYPRGVLTSNTLDMAMSTLTDTTNIRAIAVTTRPNAWVSLHLYSSRNSGGDSVDDKCNDNRAIYRCPVIGRVSMDMLAIDLSGVPNPTIGSRVVLWGDAMQGYPHVDMVATSADTISYELLCRLSQRPTRQVV